MSAVVEAFGLVRRRPGGCRRHGSRRHGLRVDRPDRPADRASAPGPSPYRQAHCSSVPGLATSMITTLAGRSGAGESCTKRRDPTRPASRRRRRYEAPPLAGICDRCPTRRRWNDRAEVQVVEPDQRQRNEDQRLGLGRRRRRYRRGLGRRRQGKRRGKRRWQNEWPRSSRSCLSTPPPSRCREYGGKE